jgi:PAS domain S-box-containing protein
MNGDSIKLLLIEDNAELSRLISGMLSQTENPSFQITSATHLSQGVEHLAAGAIDLVVLDLALPDAQGLEGLNQLRAQNPAVPIVVLTGLEDENTALESLREGAQDYLLKGEMSQPMLVRAIRYAIERQRGEEARSRLAAIVESSKDAIVGMSLEGLIVSWNPGAEHIFGYAFEEVIGRSISLLSQPESADEMPALLDQLKSGEHLRDFETLRMKKNNISIHVAISLSPIKSSLGAIIGASMIARDIDERKRAEETLRETQEQTRLIVDTAFEAFVAINAGGMIIDWNPQATATFGWSREEVIGRPLVETIVPMKYREAHLRGLNRFLSTGEGPVLNRPIEITALHRDGREFAVELTISPLRRGKGYIFNAFIHDITERKKAEAEREALIQDLQAALANIKALSGLLPICASCKKIKDDQGYWQQVETYIGNRTEAEFTHGLCPECAQRYREDVT